MLKGKMIAAASMLALAGGAHAQDVIHWAAPPTAAQGRYLYFPMGTPLVLRTRDALSTRDSRIGDRVYFEVAEPIVYGSQTVVPAGSPAIGEVAHAEHTGSFGKRGELGVRLLYAQTPSGPVRLNGKVDRVGTGQEVLSIGGAVLIAWPMLFIHGTSARLPAGATVTAYLAEDLQFPAAVSDSRTVAWGGAGTAGRSLPARFDPAVFAGVHP